VESRQTSLAFAGIIVLVLLVFAGLVWVNYRYTSQNEGQASFLPRWIGFRLFLARGQSPYSEETTQEVQRMVYGRRAREGEDPKFFLYPFYSILVYAPFGMIRDPAVARAAWLAVLEVSLLITGALGLSLARWRPSPVLWVILVLFSALWFHTIRPLASGNISIVITLLITASLFSIRSEHDVLGGFLLSLAMILPQMTIVLAIFVLVWAASNERWLIFWSFLGSLALMIIASSLLVPNMLLENLRQVLLYYNYARYSSPGGLFARSFPGIGHQIGWALTVFTAGILFWEWREARRKDFRWFLWVAYLTLTLTNFIGLFTSIEYHIAMYPALLLVLATWDERWGTPGRVLIGGSVLILFFGLWGLALLSAQRGIPPELNPRIFFFMPIFMLITLYWTRWWATRPPRLPIETLAKIERGGPR